MSADVPAPIPVDAPAVDPSIVEIKSGPDNTVRESLGGAGILGATDGEVQDPKEVLGEIAKTVDEIAEKYTDREPTALDDSSADRMLLDPLKVIPTPEGEVSDPKEVLDGIAETVDGIAERYADNDSTPVDKNSTLTTIDDGTKIVFEPLKYNPNIRALKNNPKFPTPKSPQFVTSPRKIASEIGQLAPDVIERLREEALKIGESLDGVQDNATLRARISEAAATGPDRNDRVLFTNKNGTSFDAKGRPIDRVEAEARNRSADVPVNPTVTLESMNKYLNAKGEAETSNPEPKPTTQAQ